MEKWDRQEGEGNLWYDRFTRYRLLGARRSLLAACNAERKEVGKGTKKQTSGAWTENAAKWHWKERAEAWDEQQRSETLRILEDAALRAAQKKVDGLDSRKENIAQAVATEILDRVLGKTQKIEVAAPGGKPLTFNVVWNDGKRIPEDAT